MNNSGIDYESSEEKKSKEEKLSFLKNQKGELTQIIEAVNRVEASEDWQKLKKLLLDDVVVSLERQLQNEASKKEVSPPELYRLQGQVAWARKYADLKKLSEFLKQQLKNINNQLKL